MERFLLYALCLGFAVPRVFAQPAEATFEDRLKQYVQMTRRLESARIGG